VRWNAKGEDSAEAARLHGARYRAGRATRLREESRRRRDNILNPEQFLLDYAML
jgi:hypothetical protein